MADSGPIADTLVVLPTYNECENIERVIRMIGKHSSQLHVLVVDDNSLDGTGGIADMLALQDNRVQVFHRARKLGSASAYKLGFEHALRYNYRQVITMNADFSHNPRYLPQMVKMALENDCVVGSRYLPAGGTLGGNLAEHVANRALNGLVRKALVLPVTDCTSRLRCYRSEMLAKINYETIKTEGAAFGIEIMNRCIRMGYRMAEMPILYDGRRLSRSAHHPQRLVLSAETVFRLWVRRLSGGQQVPANAGPVSGKY